MRRNFSLARGISGKSCLTVTTWQGAGNGAGPADPFARRADITEFELPVLSQAAWTKFRHYDRYGARSPWFPRRSGELRGQRHRWRHEDFEERESHGYKPHKRQGEE